MGISDFGLAREKCVESCAGSVLSRLFFEKKYGRVIRGGKVYYRNYGRELKNGNGMDYLEAQYDMWNSCFTPLFDDLG